MKYRNLRKMLLKIVTSTQTTSQQNSNVQNKIDDQTKIEFHMTLLIHTKLDTRNKTPRPHKTWPLAKNLGYTQNLVSKLSSIRTSASTRRMLQRGATFREKRAFFVATLTFIMDPHFFLDVGFYVTGHQSHLV